MNQNGTTATALDPELPAIESRGINHFYGEGEARTQVLFNNDMTISRGEIVIMTGPSGSGKTTLLTLIGGLRSVQQGSLKVLGQELAGLDRGKLIALRKGIGFIFQQHNLFSSLTAMENVRLSMELRGMDVPAMHERAAAMLDRLGLTERLHYRPANLSGGQRQRVAIARALVNQPPLVLADEPTAALDAVSSKTVMELLRELAEGPSRSTILVVTHDKRIIDNASRIINMVEGRIISNVRADESVRIIESLSRSEAFAHLSPADLVNIADRVLNEVYPAGAEIIRQGEAGDRFFIIDEGTVEVYRDGQFHREMSAGDFFGEIALITDKPRSATVIAKTPVKVFTLSKQDFMDVMARFDTLEARVKRAYMDRQ